MGKCSRVVRWLILVRLSAEVRGVWKCPYWLRPKDKALTHHRVFSPLFYWLCPNCPCTALGRGRLTGRILATLGPPTSYHASGQNTYLSSLLTLWRSSQCCAWCPLQLTIFTVEAFSLTPLLLVWGFGFFLVCFFVIPWLPWLFSQFHDGSDSV